MGFVPGPKRDIAGGGGNPFSGMASLKPSKMGRSGGMRFEFFFDRARVIRAIGKSRAKSLARAGALVRTVARRSIKFRTYKSGIVSAPGNPPFTHRKKGEGGNFKNIRVIDFNYSPIERNVVIGPMSPPGTPHPVVGALEHGGTTTRIVSPTKKNPNRSVQRYRIQKRPFMQPALKKTKHRYAKFWENSIK